MSVINVGFEDFSDSNPRNSSEGLMEEVGVLCTLK